MPELVFHRVGVHPPVKRVCMYCGRPAAHRREWTVRNPETDPPDDRATGTRYWGNSGDGTLALILLPLALVGLVLEWRARNTPSSLVPDHTVVTVTTCPRHRRYGWRFVWLVVLWAVTLGGVWAVAVQWNRVAPNQTPLWLLGVLLFLALGVPLILSFVYAEHGPVRVTRVRRDSVTLGFVRPAYFRAPEPPA
jgi:hypothetical protein